jgi:hypothetical protein
MPVTDHPLPLSFGIDPESVLVLDGDACVRRIRPASRDFFAKVIRSECVRQAVDAGRFIASEIAEASHDELVVRHPVLPHVLYPHEWTPSMLRDAALLVLDLIEHLEPHGYTLKDGTPWNVVFRGPNPVWVDLTSVADSAVVGAFPARVDFWNYFVRPLQLFAADLGPFARLGLTQWLGPPPTWLDDPSAVQAGRAFHQGRRAGLRLAATVGRSAITNKLLRHPQSTSLPTTINGLREVVTALDVTPKHGEWSGYYTGKNELPTFAPHAQDLERLAQSTPKHRLLWSLFDQYRPATLLDIGCNTGLYSFLANSFGATTIGVDTDERAVDEMYHAARSHRRDVVSGCVDFVTPLRVAEYLHKPRLRPLHARVRSDMVLCLAVVHHWVFKRTQLQLTDVVDILAGVTERILVVEFVPPLDKHVQGWMTPAYQWYSLDNFVAVLRGAFSRIEVHDSFPEPRKLLVCVK